MTTPLLKPGRAGPAPPQAARAQSEPAPRGTTEILLLPSGRILAHNLTPALAVLLAEMDPADAVMSARAGASRAPPLTPRLQNHLAQAMSNHPPRRRRSSKGMTLEEADDFDRGLT